MTSTHLDPVPNHAVVLASANSIPDPIASASLDDSESADSSFSDAYKEQDHGKQKNYVEDVNQSVEDDYAMTFESDGEENSDSQDISQANIEQETASLPAPLPAPVPASELTSTIISNDHSTIPGTLYSGQDTQPTHLNPPPSLPTIADGAATNLSDSLPAQSPPDTLMSQNPTYEDVASGGIDIQQLLDNITANAEKNEASSTVASPSSANTPKPSLPKGSSALPAHASLPPRPQLPQKPPKRSNYPHPDDAQKYFIGGQSFPQIPNSYRPPGVTTSLIAAGAPGTSTDPRTGLPPPPSASFRPPSLSTVSPISPVPNAQVSRLSTRDQPTKSIERVERSDEVDDADRPWLPAVQKIYDEFLAEERINVTEGLWDRFPVGSRLFIGSQILVRLSGEFSDTYKQAIFQRRKLLNATSSMFSTSMESLLKYQLNKHTDSFNFMTVLLVTGL
jgi:nuclear polyadenylated RNA-binding protein 3